MLRRFSVLAQFRALRVPLGLERLVALDEFLLRGDLGVLLDALGLLVGVGDDFARANDGAAGPEPTDGVNSQAAGDDAGQRREEQDRVPVQKPGVCAMSAKVNIGSPRLSQMCCSERKRGDGAEAG